MRKRRRLANDKPDELNDSVKFEQKKESRETLGSLLEQAVKDAERRKKEKKP